MRSLSKFLTSTTITSIVTRTDNDAKPTTTKGIALFCARNAWVMFKVDPFPSVLTVPLSGAAVVKHLQHDHLQILLYGADHLRYDGTMAPRFDKLHSTRMEIKGKSPGARCQVEEAVALSSQSGAETGSGAKYFPYLQAYVSVRSVSQNVARRGLRAHTWSDGTAPRITGDARRRAKACWDVGSALFSRSGAFNAHIALTLYSITHAHTTQNPQWLMKELT